ncbi:FtsB family cell division protein [Nocardia arthritidis]|uniref:Septum formation initiator family protein n=1 Tax=Nocardia arthritidis TaxID=228602 RepID=A0A6G9YR47_9NOCA|nr:septum formation initiator family protein [Nocardia arthritidis]QIS15682.1 septum formation initiator family protein [Nocardia arthritidis]
MSERRGAGPSGRGDRRTSRTPRPRAGHETAARPAAKRTTRAEKKAEQQKFESRAAHRDSERHERKFLGLSTGKAIILAIVVCALALTLAVPMRTYFAQRSEAKQLQQQRVELEADLARLRDRRAQQQDPAYLKAQARDRLRLVMPGETPYLVQVPGIEAPSPSPVTGPPKAPDPWYTDLWRTISQPQQTPAAASPPGPAPEGPR